MFRKKDTRRYYVTIELELEDAEGAWRIEEVFKGDPELKRFDVYEIGELSLDEDGKLGVKLKPVEKSESSQ